MAFHELVISLLQQIFLEITSILTFIDQLFPLFALL